MSRDEIRREEDYFEGIDLTICDGCAHEGEDCCRRCSHHYDSLYQPNEVIQAVRKYHDNRGMKEKH